MNCALQLERLRGGKSLNDKKSSITTKILNAIIEDPEIVLLLKEKYVTDEIWKFCIERDPNLFKRMKRPSLEICMYACEVDGSNLKYIKHKFRYIKITDTMCFISVKSNPKAILYVPEKYLNHELEEMAFDKDPSLMNYFNDIRSEYAKKIIREKPYAIQYLPAIYEDDVCEVLKENPNLCPYLDGMTLKMLNILKEYHPTYYNLYKNSLKEINDEKVG